MTESLVSQIVIDDVTDKNQNVLIEKKKSKRGRKPKLTDTKYLEAVRRTKSLKDSDIAKYLGLDRSTVYYYRNDEKHFENIIQAKEIVENIKRIRFDNKIISRYAFDKIPIIVTWQEMQIARNVGEKAINDRITVLYNVCKYLKTNPDNIGLDQVAKLVVDMRQKYEKEIKTPRGLSYYNIRKPIRSYFELIRGVSGELLTSKGIDASRTKGAGSQAKERVTKEQRKRFEDTLKTSIDNHEERCELDGYDISKDMLCCEVLGLSHFMYYTATRIGSSNSGIISKKGSLSIKLNNPAHKLLDKKWSIHVLDKGNKGGMWWDKILIDDGLHKMKQYISKRFEVKPDNLEVEILEIDDYLFPFLCKQYKLETSIMKEGLHLAGNKTTIPNHIWRHTFAQDFLHASDWNYELCASIGGWKDTSTLKRHYGKMSDEAKERGLKKAMGLPVEDVTYELRW